MHLSIFQNTASDVDIHTHTHNIRTDAEQHILKFYNFTSCSKFGLTVLVLHHGGCFHLLLLLFSLKTVFDLYAFITFFPQLIQLTLSRLMNSPFLYFRVSTVSSVPISPHHTHINTHARARARTHTHTHTRTCA